jgi:hypothetical protein
MANALYPKWREALMQAAANSGLNGTVKIALVDTSVYTYNAAHDFLDDLGGSRIGTDQTLTGKTFVNGVFDAADPTWPTGGGVSVEALVIYIDTGLAGTSRLVAYLDTGYDGLPVTNSGGVTVEFDAAGIFTLGGGA